MTPSRRGETGCVILIAVIGFGTTSQLQRFHDRKLACDERSVAQSHSNQYQSGGSAIDRDRPDTYNWKYE